MPTRLLAAAALLAVFAAPPAQRVPLTGKVIDETTKKPIADFHLVLRRGTVAEPGEIVAERKVHNQRGTFTVYVPPGVVLLTVDSAGRLPAEQMVSGGGKPLTIALQAGAVLHGRVLGPDGKPLPNVDVTVDFFSPAAGQRRELHATTDASGNFSLLTQVGERNLHFQSEGFVTEERHVAAKKPRAAVPDVQLVRPVSISGSVVDDLGQPLAQARVRATLQSTTMHELRDATTNAEGKFTIEPLRPGKYNIDVTMALHVPRKIENVDTPIAAPLQVHLERGSLVRGFVRGSTDAERPYVTVYLGPTVMTLINLKEEFGINAVPAGRVPVYAEVQQSGSVRRTPLTTIETTNGGSTNAELALAEGPVVTGTITEAQKAPTRPVVVQFLPPNPQAFPPPMSVMTNEDGSFRIVGLTPGTYDVKVAGREVISPKNVTIGIANTNLTIDVKPLPRPALPNLPPDLKPPQPHV